MASTAKLDIQISQDIHDRLTRAAEIQGISVNDFVVTAATDAACRVIADVELVQLTRKGQRRLAELIASPPAPKAALWAAFETHRATLSTILAASETEGGEHTTADLRTFVAAYSNRS